MRLIKIVSAIILAAPLSAEAWNCDDSVLCEGCRSKKDPEVLNLARKRIDYLQDEVLNRKVKETKLERLNENLRRKLDELEKKAPDLEDRELLEKRFAETEERNSELKERLRENDAKVAKTKDQLKLVREEMRQENELTQRLEKEIRSMEKSKQSVEAKLLDLEAKTKLAEEVKNHCSDFSLVKAAAAALCSSITHSIRHGSAEDQDHEKLVQRFNEAQIYILELQLKLKTKEVGEAVSVEELRAENANNTKILEKANGKVVELEKKLRWKGERMKKQLVELEERKRKVIEYEEQLRLGKAAMKGKMVEVKEGKRQVVELEKQLRLRGEAMKKIVDELEERKGKVIEFEEQLRLSKEAMKQKVVKFEERMQSKDEVMNKKRVELEERKGKVTQFEEQLRLSKEAIKEKVAELKEMNGSKADAEKRLSEAQIEIEHLKSTIEEWKNKYLLIEESQNEVEDLKIVIEDFKGKAFLAEEALETERAKMSTATTEMKTMNENIASRDVVIHDLQNKFFKCDAERNDQRDTRSELKTLHANFAEINRDNQELRKRLESIAEDKRAKELELSEIKTELPSRNEKAFIDGNQLVAFGVINLVTMATVAYLAFQWGKTRGLLEERRPTSSASARSGGRGKFSRKIGSLPDLGISTTQSSRRSSSVDWIEDSDESLATFVARTSGSVEANTDRRTESMEANTDRSVESLSFVKVPLRRRIAPSVDGFNLIDKSEKSTSSGTASPSYAESGKASPPLALSGSATPSYAESGKAKPSCANSDGDFEVISNVDGANDGRESRREDRSDQGDLEELHGQREPMRLLIRLNNTGGD